METERTGNARPPMNYIFVRFGNRQALGVASMNLLVKVSREFSGPFNPRWSLTSPTALFIFPASA